MADDKELGDFINKVFALLAEGHKAYKSVVEDYNSHSDICIKEVC